MFARLYFFLIGLLISTELLAQTIPQFILVNAHSHNDYTRNRPLYDALENGFFSIEVDVWQYEGEYKVAHVKTRIKKAETLKNQYLVPLSDIVNKNDGTVYPNGPLEFRVMIDLKGQWSEEDLVALDRYLEPFKTLFTVYKDGNGSPGAIRLLLSGNGGKYKSIEMEPRYFSIDGGLNDITSEHDSTLIPRTSTRYKSEFKWKGRGRQPQAEKEKLLTLINLAHENGRKIRFWATPDRVRLWEVLTEAGVDWINVDRLKKFNNFNHEHFTERSSME